MRALAIAVLAAGCQSPSNAATRGPLDGWHPLAYKDGSCGLYAPASRAELPPPLAWRPCAEAVGMPACRRLALDWAPNPKLPEWIAPATFASRDGRGKLLLHTARYQADGTIRMIAEVDGPVRIALREQSDRCALGAAPGDGDHYAFRVYDSEATGELDSFGGGAVGGALDELVPRVMMATHDRVARSVVAGAPGLLELGAGGAMTLHPWGAGAPERSAAPNALWSSAQGGGLAQVFPAFQGEALLWAAHDDGTRKHMVWTAGGGVQELLASAAELGTDGHDLVWLEGHRDLEGDGFTDVRVVTAPFTTDPAQIRPRVVRNGGSAHPFGTSPFVVGCGHAARAMFDGQSHHAIEVIRLADGATWQLPDAAGSTLGYRAPLALTCDELFARVYERSAAGQPGHFNVARVRLDGLGTPVVPDR